ncbi:MAG: hypothetical protein WCW67_00075 [Candidatus Margulisiibacteriota bacterium]
MAPKIETRTPSQPRRAIKPMSPITLGATFTGLNEKEAGEVIDKTIRAFPHDRLLVIVDGLSGTGKTYFCRQLKSGRRPLSRPTSQIVHLTGDILHDLIEKAANGFANNRNLLPQYQWPFEQRTAYQHSCCPEYALAKYFGLNHQRLFGRPPTSLVLYDCVRSFAYIRGMVDNVGLFKTNPPPMIGLFVRIVPKVTEVPALNWYDIGVESINPRGSAYFRGL